MVNYIVWYTWQVSSKDFDVHIGSTIKFFSGILGSCNIIIKDTRHNTNEHDAHAHIGLPKILLNCLLN